MKRFDMREHVIHVPSGMCPASRWAGGKSQDHGGKKSQQARDARETTVSPRSANIRQTSSQTDRHLDRQTPRHPDRQTPRQTDKQQTDRQSSTGRHVCRQTSRHIVGRHLGRYASRQTGI